MDQTTLLGVAEVLSKTGPWGLLVILGVAYWRTLSRKEDEIKELYARLGELTEAQIKAIDDMRDSLRDLCQMIGVAFLRWKPSKPPENKKPG